MSFTCKVAITGTDVTPQVHNSQFYRLAASVLLAVRLGVPTYTKVDNNGEKWRNLLVRDRVPLSAV